MKRLISVTFGAILLTLTPALPAQATVNWVCTVPGVGDVTFVSVPDAALHGIDTANKKAGQVFKDQFNEVCKVVVVP